MELAHRGSIEPNTNSSAYTYDLISMELNHRIANSLQLVSSFLLLQERDTLDTEARNALKAAASRVAAVGIVHRALIRQSGETIDLRSFLESLCAHIRAATGLTISTEIDESRIECAKAQYVAIVVNEMLLNAARHAYGETGGTVVVSCKSKAGRSLLVAVTDHGRGLPINFDCETKSSVGMTILRSAALQLGGTVRLKSGKGVRAELKFPLGQIPADRASAARRAVRQVGPA